VGFEDGEGGLEEEVEVGGEGLWRILLVGVSSCWRKGVGGSLRQGGGEWNEGAKNWFKG